MRDHHFKVGDAVEVVKNLWDSAMAVEIGSLYRIINIDGTQRQPYLLEGTRQGNWWIADGCLSPSQLEND